MIPRTGWAIVVVLTSIGCLVTTCAAEPATGKVGGAGDLRRIVVLGTTTIPASVVEDSLKVNLDLRWAAHPAAPLEGYLQLLPEKVKAGFLQSGFPEVEVRTRFRSEDGKIVVRVEEGPRFMADEVRIEGATPEVCESVRRAVTSPWPPKGAIREEIVAGKLKTPERWVNVEGCVVDLDAPVWRSGRPVSFLPEHKQKVARRIDLALESLGYYAAWHESRIVRNVPRRKASLEIRIHEVGPKAILGHVVIQGEPKPKHSSEVVAKYLGLRPGMPLTGEVCQRMRDRLWASGRFYASDVCTRRTAIDRSHIDLHIHLTEYPKALLLDEPLRKEDEVLLRCRRWLLNPDQWHSDLVVRSLPPELPWEFILSPRQGVLFRLADTNQRKAQGWATVAMATNECFGVYRPRDGRKAECHPLTVTLRFFLALLLSHDEERPHKVTYSFWIGNPDGTNRGEFISWLASHPAVFLGMAYEHNAKSSFSKEGTLVIQSDAGRWEIESTSGRVRECSWCDESGRRSQVRVAFESGLFERVVQETKAATAGLRNEWSTVGVWFSLIRFLSGDHFLYDLYTTTPSDPVAANVLGKMVERVWLSLLSRKTEADADTHLEEFGIPDELNTDNDTGTIANALCLLDTLVPRDSWPWLLGHERVWVTFGKTQYTHEQVLILRDSTKSGPMCALSMAYLWSSENREATLAWARLGLDRLNAEGFRRDYAFLLEPESLKWVTEIVAVLRGLDAREVQAFKTLFPAEDAKYVAEGIRILQAKADRPVKEALPLVLDAMWNAGLRERVRQALIHLEQASQPTPAKVTQK